MERKKILLCLLIATAFVIPLLGNTALSEDRSTEIVWFYFDDYDHFYECWSGPGEMVDGDPDDYAFTTTDGDEELCNANNCSGSGSGTITGVEIAAKGYYTGSYRDIILCPVFSGSDEGDDHIFDDVPEGIGNADWSDWFDITDDDNTHEWWTWSNVQELDVMVTAGTGGTAFALFCSMVKIRVTYEIP